MRLIVFRKVLVFKTTSKMQYPNSVWWISQDLLIEMFIHRIFTYQYQSLKNIHFIVYPINCYIFANEKSCLTSKHMHIAEIRTVAKLLPLLRWNTHKSLILSYSEYLGRFSDKIYAGKAPGAYSIGGFLFLMLLPFTFPFGRWPLVQGVWSKTCETWVIYHLIFFENVFNKDTFQGIIHIKKLLHHVHPTINIILRWAL